MISSIWFYQKRKERMRRRVWTMDLTLVVFATTLVSCCWDMCQAASLRRKISVMAPARVLLEEADFEFQVVVEIEEEQNPNKGGALPNPGEDYEEEPTTPEDDTLFCMERSIIASMPAIAEGYFTNVMGMDMSMGWGEVEKVVYKPDEVDEEVITVLNSNKGEVMEVTRKWEQLEKLEIPVHQEVSDPNNAKKKARANEYEDNPEMLQQGAQEDTPPVLGMAQEKSKNNNKVKKQQEKNEDIGENEHKENKTMKNKEESPPTIGQETQEDTPTTTQKKSNSSKKHKQDGVRYEDIVGNTSTVEGVDGGSAGDQTKSAKNRKKVDTVEGVRYEDIVGDTVKDGVHGSTSEQKSDKDKRKEDLRDEGVRYKDIVDEKVEDDTGIQSGETMPAKQKKKKNLKDETVNTAGDAEAGGYTGGSNGGETKSNKKNNNIRKMAAVNAANQKSSKHKNLHKQKRFRRKKSWFCTFKIHARCRLCDPDDFDRRTRQLDLSQNTDRRLMQVFDFQTWMSDYLAEEIKRDCDFVDSAGVNFWHVPSDLD